MKQDEEDEFLDQLPDEAPEHIAKEVFAIWDQAVLRNNTREEAKKAINEYLLSAYGKTLVIDDFEVSEYGALTIRWSYDPAEKANGN